MNNLYFDIGEILLAAFALYALGKNIVPYLRFTKKTLLLTCVYAAIYVGAIFLLQNTVVGEQALAPFVDRGLVTGSVWFLLAYAITLVFSEELFFRIYLSKKIHTVLAASIFSVAHWRPDSFPILMFPILFIFALLQQSLLQKTTSLWSISIAHITVLTTLIILYG